MLRHILQAAEPKAVDVVSQDTFLYWGAFVTLFLFLAFILTVRQIFENHLAEKQERLRKEQEMREVAESNSGL